MLLEMLDHLLLPLGTLSVVSILITLVYFEVRLLNKENYKKDIIKACHLSYLEGLNELCIANPHGYSYSLHDYADMRNMWKNRDFQLYFKPFHNGDYTLKVSWTKSPMVSIVQ